jgi:hypothetical protein
MKTITTKYIQGLASFLDSKSIRWKMIKGEKDDYIQFRIHADWIWDVAIEFGNFYHNDSNY